MNMNFLFKEITVTGMFSSFLNRIEFTTDE